MHRRVLLEPVVGVQHPEHLHDACHPVERPHGFVDGREEADRGPRQARSTAAQLLRQPLEVLPEEVSVRSEVAPRLHLMMRGERDAVPLNDARTPRPTREADEGRYRLASHLNVAQRTVLEELRSELE